LATLKSLPSTYDKDLQEDKLPVFQGFDILMGILPVISNALKTLTINKQKMESSIESTMMATDLADFLVVSGIPFREAHTLAGQTVRLALAKDKSLDQLTLSEFQSINPILDERVYEVFDPRESIARRKVIGGTAPEAVKEQIKKAKKRIGEIS
jgi:argininosuccinate lyase